MSQVEGAATTLMRLLNRYLSVVKDDGGLANIFVSNEWHDRELLKNYDAQITVGLERCDDQKISFDGNLRRRLGFARINVWVADKPEQGIMGRALRDLICVDVNRVVREKRTKPNQTDSCFRGIGRGSGTHKAYFAASTNELAASDQDWIEFADDEYQKIWYSDDNRVNISAWESGKHALMLFRFKVDANENAVKQVILSFEGFGTAPLGNGVTIKVWNHTVNAWQNAISATGENDETVSTSLSSNLPDFIDSSGYVYLLAKTTNAANESAPAILYCDFVQIVFVVNGISYADIAGFRDVGEVRVKPFLWHTEFSIKTWMFETVPTT
jgi:hypothetical protein